MLAFSDHSLVLLLGVAVAGLALVGAIAVGPYGSRGVRLTLGAVSFTAFLASAFWLFLYFGWIDQRRSIETRLAELRTQALGPGSPLACLEQAGSAIEAACAQSIFASPETLSMASFYTAARLDLLGAATRYAGPRTPEFDSAIDTLGASLQQDPFGLTANALVLLKGCTAQRCSEIAVFQSPERVLNNIREKAFDANVARHAANWRAPAAAPVASAPAPAVAPSLTPTGETRAPIPDKYTLPSSASIPPVSIMTDEPAVRPEPASPPAAKDRASAPRQPAAAVQESQEQEQAQTPAPPAKASSERPAQPRQKARPNNAPLSITPQPQ